MWTPARSSRKMRVSRQYRSSKIKNDVAVHMDGSYDDAPTSSSRPSSSFWKRMLRECINALTFRRCYMEQLAVSNTWS